MCSIHLQCFFSVKLVFLYHFTYSKQAPKTLRRIDRDVSGDPDRGDLLSKPEQTIVLLNNGQNVIVQTDSFSELCEPFAHAGFELLELFMQLLLLPCS